MPARERRRSGLSRLAAGMLVAMAVVMEVGVVSGPSAAGYARVLVACVLVAGAVTAVKLWWHNCFESRLAAVLLAVMTVVGQVLAVTLGGPGSDSAHWQATALAAVLLGGAVPVLVGLDARHASPSGKADAPYAL
jgi:hypothetical protein